MNAIKNIIHISYIRLIEMNKSKYLILTVLVLSVVCISGCVKSTGPTYKKGKQKMVWRDFEDTKRLNNLKSNTSKKKNTKGKKVHKKR
ncbi:hypothetical protein [Persicobacter diffluens]|uniref:Uncharacterized protein n=1 Tax=Persicobacter diffluens TaxID=981 RepID=A0AAN4VZ53_9BACT|nr:hypothetical protein PEDI_32960 [Persicobacter diffluens]